MSRSLVMNAPTVSCDPGSHSRSGPKRLVDALKLYQENRSLAHYRLFGYDENRWSNSKARLPS